MAVPDDQIYPDNQLLDRAVPTIARLEASLADEHEATRLALNSANLLETLTPRRLRRDTRQVSQPVAQVRKFIPRGVVRFHTTYSGAAAG